MSERPVVLVAIGAAAGGLEAPERLFAALPAPYKRGRLGRRIKRHMNMHGLQSLEAYVTMVEQAPEEATSLAQDLLISVTRFFREPEAFDVLTRFVVPVLIDATPVGEVVCIRVPRGARGLVSNAVHHVFREHGEMAYRDIGVDLETVALQVLRTGRMFEREVTLSSGRLLLLRARTFVTAGPERRGVVVTLRDVTPLHEVRVRLQSVVDSLLEHIAVVDARPVPHRHRAAPLLDARPRAGPRRGGRR